MIGVVGLRGDRWGGSVGRGWAASMGEVVRVEEVVSAAIASVEEVVQPISVVAVCFAEEVMVE